jgi:hypothetical protein
MPCVLSPFIGVLSMRAMSINTWYRCIYRERLDELVRQAEHDPDAPANYIHPEAGDDEYGRPEPSLWTERNWLGLHSLLTFGAWAEQPLLGAAIAGGTPIGGDYCYADSPVRYFTVEQVREIATALQAVKEEALQRSCDPEELNAACVPPVGGWNEESFVHLWKTFCNIRDFFRMAQSHNYAVLVYLC